MKASNIKRSILSPYMNPLSIIGVVSILLIQTGCGGQAYRTQPDSPNSNPTNPSVPVPSSGSSNQIPGITPGTASPTNVTPGPTVQNPSNPQPTPTPSSAGFVPTLSESFDLSGAGGVKPIYNSPNQIVTDNLLRVKISAGMSGKVTAEGSGYSAPYRCVTFSITIGGHTIDKTLSIDLADGRYTSCAGAPHSDIVDFSGVLTPGHGSLTMSITAKGYDFQCQYFQEQPGSMPVNGVYLQNINPYYTQQFLAAGLQTYCTKLTPVALQHVVSGTAEIQTSLSKGL